MVLCSCVCVCVLLQMRAIATVQLYSNGNVTGLDGDGAAIAKALESVAGSS